jgi:hypothetical protein
MDLNRNPSSGTPGPVPHSRLSGTEPTGWSPPRIGRRPVGKLRIQPSILETVHLQDHPPDDRQLSPQ